MRLARQIAVVVLVLGLLAMSGCKKKKPPVPQPQTQAPTITAPPPQQPPVQTQPPVVTLPPPTTTEPTKPPATNTKPSAAKPKPKHRAPKKAANGSTTTAKTTPPVKPGTKNTVTDGGANDPGVQISAEVPTGEAAQQRQSTMNLLDSTETNLRKINSRQLSDGDQATARQIRNYITQSRLAMQDGDLERAYNLATKAHLLSDEMARRM